jgi:hypothetical protein
MRKICPFVVTPVAAVLVASAFGRTAVGFVVGLIVAVVVGVWAVYEIFAPRRGMSRTV